MPQKCYIREAARKPIARPLWVTKSMVLKELKILALLLTILCFSGCKIFLKPKLEKIYGFESGKKYDTHKFYSATFEIQLKDHIESRIDIYLHYLDSTYEIYLEDNDSVNPIFEKFKGEYSISKIGTVHLNGNSPFENNSFQIVVPKSRNSLFAEFKLNSKYQQIYTHKKHRAYCEVDFPWELRDCVIEEYP